MTQGKNDDGMVERLARVLASERARRDGQDRVPEWTACNEAERDCLRADVRALLRALREPTGVQLAAFARACDDFGNCMVRTGWRVMVDAAIDG